MPQLVCFHVECFASSHIAPPSSPELLALEAIAFVTVPYPGVLVAAAVKPALESDQSGRPVAEQTLNLSGTAIAGNLMLRLQVGCNRIVLSLLSGFSS